MHKDHIALGVCPIHKEAKPNFQRRAVVSFWLMQETHRALVSFLHKPETRRALVGFLH